MGAVLAVAFLHPHSGRTGFSLSFFTLGQSPVAQVGIELSSQG